MQNFSQDLSASHARLCNLENELEKERNDLIENYNRGGPNSNRTLYGSYYPMLEQYTGFADQYVMELAKFKKLLQASVQQKKHPSKGPVLSDNNNNNQQEIQCEESSNNDINNDNIENISNRVPSDSSRKFARINNGNYMNSNNDNNNNNNNNDDGKQAEIIMIEQAVCNENDTKLSSLYDKPRRPPVKSNGISSSQVSIGSHPSSIPSIPPSSIPPPPPSISQQQQQQPHKARNRTILVSRHKYKYEGRGFGIWRQNLQRPMYTSTTLKINRKFGGNEKLVRKFLFEKGGFKQELIEQISFIGKRDNTIKRSIDFTLVRVRASLGYIGKCIGKIDEECGRNIVIKQNNRSKPSNNSKNSKLYINNFDILDGNCHRKLTDIFLKFGELEQDIFIGRDKKSNPYALVHFRDIHDAVRCVQSQSNFKQIIYFPPIDMNELENNEYNNNYHQQQLFKYLNRKLHIEYNRSDDQISGNNRRGRGRGRGRARGNRGYQSRR